MVPALVITFALWVTSLPGVTPRTPPPYARTFRRGTVCDSRERADFGGQNVEAPPYPPATGFCGSAPSPRALTGKPFRSGLSRLSSSSSGFLAGSSGPVLTRTRFLRTRALPARAALCGPLEPFTRFGTACFGSSPRRLDFHLLQPPRPSTLRSPVCLRRPRSPRHWVESAYCAPRGFARAGTHRAGQARLHASGSTSGRERAK